MKKTQKLYFIASVKDEYLESMDQVVDHLRSKGCEITDIHKFTGVITGNVHHDVDLNSLKVEGIASMEKQRQVKKN